MLSGIGNSEKLWLANNQILSALLIKGNESLQDKPDEVSGQTHSCISNSRCFHYDSYL